MIEFAFVLAKLIEGICLTMFLIIFPNNFYLGRLQ